MKNCNYIQILFCNNDTTAHKSNEPFSSSSSCAVGKLLSQSCFLQHHPHRFEDFDFGTKFKFVLMKYKKGSIVEVLVKDDFGNHSWRCAQIVSGNGFSYTVSYDVYPGFSNKADVERIFVKCIRPCPPLLEITESWSPGDVVEVFYNLSWKMATVLKDFEWDRFLVRLVGSFQEFEVTKSEIRVRQSFENDEWIIIDKVTRDYMDTKCAKLLESPIISCKTPKRSSPYCYFQDEVNEKRARRTSPEKVVAVANRKENITLEDNDTDSIMSSSGSCSTNNSSYKPYDIYHESGHESDAESVCQLEYDEETDHSPTNEELADGIHSLELHAYRSTMEALHALGPLTWEKESMVTNLRILLHISNDEHLIMLKNLISAASNSRYR